MNKVVKIKLLESYKVWLEFDDGFSNEIDLEPYLGRGIAKELLQKEKFKTLKMEAGGGIAFYNGYDFCPNHLRMLMDKNYPPTSTPVIESQIKKQ